MKSDAYLFNDINISIGDLRVFKRYASVYLNIGLDIQDYHHGVELTVSCFDW